MQAQSIENFWALVVDVWSHGFMGVAVNQIIYAMGILLAAFLVRRLFSFLFLRQLDYWTQQTNRRFHDRLVEALLPPVRFIPIVIAVFFATHVLTPNEKLAAILVELTRSLVAFNIFWALFRVVEPLFTLLDRVVMAFSRATIEWLTRAAKIVFVALGAATILEIWGIRVGPILAGLGLFGVAIALGAQDLFKNLISGIFIIGERRFQHGDWIKADGVVEGTVETIGLRTTKVRRFDKAPVFVPNSELADNAVTNFSQMNYRRISWVIGVEHRTTLDQLRTIRDGIEAFILENDDFAHPPEVPAFVRIDSFNESSIDIMIYCFTRSTVWGEWLKTKEDLTYAIKSIVEEAGSGFALPSRSLYLEALPAQAEVFPLQKEPASVS